MPVPNVIPRAAPAAGRGPSRAAAAREIVSIEASLARTGRTILDELASSFTPGQHYPAGEIWDPVTHAQYFYHAHPESGQLAAEHGHFHTFLGRAGMPAGMAPLVLPEMAMAGTASVAADPGTHRSPRDRGVFSHLIGLSIDRRGQPIGLFTTNRWVTGETWYRAEDVVRMLPHFIFGGDQPPVDRWLASILCVLAEPIAELIRERDMRIMAWRRERSRHHHVFDDRRLERVANRRIMYPAELAAALAQID